MQSQLSVSHWETFQSHFDSFAIFISSTHAMENLSSDLIALQLCCGVYVQFFFFRSLLLCLYTVYSCIRLVFESGSCCYCCCCFRLLLCGYTMNAKLIRLTWTSKENKWQNARWCNQWTLYTNRIHKWIQMKLSAFVLIFCNLTTFDPLHYRIRFDSIRTGSEW